MSGAKRLTDGGSHGTVTRCEIASTVGAGGGGSVQIGAQPVAKVATRNAAKRVFRGVMPRRIATAMPPQVPEKRWSNRGGGATEWSRLRPCRRDVGGGSIEVIETPLPAVVAAQVGLNEPRYATALNIIRAKKKPVDTLTADELGVTGANRKTRLKNFELPPPK